ncbi:MAG: nucleoside/nucleotide kinase family protein [Clostridia bacterium]|nr:nucleoside/nucleotide kinase family protein [Clostridia bacterium]
MERKLVINGFEVSAVWDENTVEDILLPLLETWKTLHKQKEGRLIAFLAAPPATGKSTLAAYLELLAAKIPHMPSLQAVGMDGFHYPQAYISSHTVWREGKELPMQRVKGAPETFDVNKLSRALADLRKGDGTWPVYDRTVHDVKEDALRVTADIVLVEGNYLLLDEEIWRNLPHDYAVFITAEEPQLKARLIARKMRGGATREEALSHYETADGPNVRLTLEKRLPADLTLRMLGDGKLEAL